MDYARLDTWMLLGLLAWLMACILLALIGNCRQRELERENAALTRRCKDLQAERDTVMQRYAAEQSHIVLIRDEENDRLRAEIKALSAKYRALERAVGRMWPKSTDEHTEKETTK